MPALLDTYVRTQLEDGRYRWQCSVCGMDKTCRTCENLYHQCPGPKQPTSVLMPEPSLARKAVNFTKAAAKHVIAGLNRVSDDVVQERFAICQQCEKYKSKGPNHGVCTHSSCGCNLKQVGVSGSNKLRWPESECPLGKWGAIND